MTLTRSIHLNEVALTLLLIHAAATSRPQDRIPRDTSFTVFSTVEKVLKQYPHARFIAPQSSERVHVEQNIPYSTVGDRVLHLDIFRPKAAGRYPAVMLIHGGGWRSGDRSQGIPMAQRIAERGYVAVTVEYRLSIEALYPAAVSDLKAAVRWLRSHSAEHAIDSMKIAALGVSAGGHLAALLGTTTGIKRFEGDGGSRGHSSTVQAVVDIDGILDFTDPAESGKDTIPGRPSVGTYWFGGPLREKRELWIDASPLVHVDSNTAPILFINSSLVRFHAGRDEMIKKLNALAIYSEVHTFPDTPHPFWFFQPWFEPTCEYTIKFLDKTLKKALR